MKNKRVLVLAICVVLATVVLSLGWLNPAKEHGVKDVRYLSQNQWDQTIAECTEAIAQDPTLAVAYNNRGYAHAQKGNYDKAIADYTRAIEIDPEYARAYNNRGFAYDNYGEFDRAIADYTRAISIDPYYTMAYYNRGFAYRATGETNKSDADFLVAGYTPLKPVIGGPGEIRTPDLLNANQANTIKLLNKLPLSTIEAFSNLSKSYICQVKNGSRPASEKLLASVEEYIKSKRPKTEYISLFLQSRESMGCTLKTMEFYRPILAKFNAEFDSTNVTRQSIEKFLNRIPEGNHNLHNRHAHYRTLKAFYNWASKEYGIDNPMASIQAPILSKVILSTLTETQIRSLLDSANNLRDKAIISTFTESGLRLSELATIKITDINFENHTIRVFGKGRKEAYAPLGNVSEQYLKAWLSQYRSDSENIWGIKRSGIVLMLRRLEAKTGITCNPHTFRRSFAVLLRKAGIDTMTIKELGRWESLEMVQRYTRSFSFQDSMKFYKSPLS